MWNDASFFPLPPEIMLDKGGNKQCTQIIIVRVDEWEYLCLYSNMSTYIEFGTVNFF